MADKTTQTIYIDADPGEVMKAIADIEATRNGFRSIRKSRS